GSAALSGGLVAFTKSDGQASGADLPGRAALWPLFALGALTLVLVTAFMVDSPDTLRSVLLVCAAFGFATGVLVAVPMGARDVPMLVAILSGFSGLAAGGLGFLLGN